MATQKEQLSDSDFTLQHEGKNLVYYTHPDGKVQEMTMAEAAALEKEQGGVIRSEADLIAPTGTPKR